MHILIFGASGKVGSQVVDAALKRGHTVTAFVHHTPLNPRKRLKSVHGDIYDARSVAAAIAGQDVIVSALGSWGTKQKNVLSTAMKSIIPAAQQSGVRRVVSLTGDGARAPGDVPTLVARLTHPILTLLFPKILQDGEAHIALLSKSSLLWSVVRSPVMTGANHVGYTLNKRSANLTVPRVAVVQAMLDLAESDDWGRSAPFIRRA